MAGPEFVQGTLCQAVCTPRVLLRCAALREVRRMLPCHSAASQVLLCIVLHLLQSCWPGREPFNPDEEGIQCQCSAARSSWHASLC